MASVVGPGVRVASSVAEVATGVAPGVTALRAGAPALAAGLVADALGAGPARSVPEALGELARRRELRLARATACLRRAQAEVAAARAEAAAAARRVPPAGAGAAPAAVRAAGRSLVAARRAVEAAAPLGQPPALDREAAGRAWAAHAAVREARAEWRRRAGAATRSLLAANVAGTALVAARLATAAVDPLFVLVAVLPLAGLARVGLATATGVRRTRAAVAARRAALEAAGVATMGALAARTTRAGAWDARAARHEAARRRAGLAEEAWRDLVGPGVDPAGAERLAGALAALAAARTRLSERQSACTAAAATLQATEDGAGAAGEPPLVVLDPCLAGADVARVAGRLLAAAGPTPVVVVLGPDRSRDRAVPVGTRVTGGPRRWGLLAGLRRPPLPARFNAFGGPERAEIP